MIVNNDHQAKLKTKKDELYQDEQFRMTVVSSIKSVDRVMLSVDSDESVCESIRKINELIKKEYGQDATVIFGK